MTENLKKFLEYASKNDDTAQKMEALADETDKDALVRQTIEIAKDAGFSLSAEDFEENAGGELSEDELASVAGGKYCYCFIGGGGEASEPDNKTCACVSYGYGKYDGEKKTRCFCILTGEGIDLDY